MAGQPDGEAEGVAVIEPKRRPGTKLVGEIPAGSDWRIVNGRIVVAGPTHEPYYLNDDGSKEIIRP